MGRDDSWLRRKEYGERWPRFCSEIPPELAAEIDAHLADVKRMHGGRISRATAVQAGLRLYLNKQRPEPEPAINSTAVEIVELEEG